MKTPKRSEGMTRSTRRCKSEGLQHMVDAISADFAEASRTPRRRSLLRKTLSGRDVTRTNSDSSQNKRGLFRSRSDKRLGKGDGSAKGAPSNRGVSRSFSDDGSCHGARRHHESDTRKLVRRLSFRRSSSWRDLAHQSSSDDRRSLRVERSSSMDPEMSAKIAEAMRHDPHAAQSSGKLIRVKVKSRS
jgi:hypothetical protein